MRPLSHLKISEHMHIFPAYNVQNHIQSVPHKSKKSELGHIDSANVALLVFLGSVVDSGQDSSLQFCIVVLLLWFFSRQTVLICTVSCFPQI